MDTAWDAPRNGGGPSFPHNVGVEADRARPLEDVIDHWLIVSGWTGPGAGRRMNVYSGVISSKAISAFRVRSALWPAMTPTQKSTATTPIPINARRRVGGMSSEAFIRHIDTTE